MPARDVPGYFVRLRNYFKPEIPILVYATQPNPVQRYKQIFDEGVTGIVTPDESSLDFHQAIRRVLECGYYISENIQKSWINLKRSFSVRSPRTEILSPRELDIYLNLGRGMSVKEIAGILGISHKTVNTYRERIKAKLLLPDSQAVIVNAAKCTQQNP